MLDLFCGLKGASAPFLTSPKWDVTTVDVETKFNPTFVRDLSRPEVYDELYQHNSNFDFVWASPPCTKFSVASIGRYWKGNKPGKEVEEEVKMLRLLVDFCKQYKYFVIENPRGMMRKVDFLNEELKRITITQCQYGKEYMKPTDLWGVFPPNWIPNPACKNGAPCHVSAPRGSNSGIQAIKSAAERAKIPFPLTDSLRKCFHPTEY